MQEEQFARFGPSELIKLAFFCALLEQTPHNPDKELVSRRFKFVKRFIEDITRVSPIESLYSAMAYSEDDTQIICRELVDSLADSKIPPSLSMWRNSVLYEFMLEYEDEEVCCKDLLDAVDVLELIQVSYLQYGNLPTANYLLKVLFILILQVDLFIMPDEFEIIKDPSKLNFFHVNDLCDISATGFPSAAISSVNLHYLFSKCSELVPLKLLEEGQKELTQSQTHALFSLQEIEVQLSTVTSIICAFMQEHIRVPLVDNVALWKFSKLYVQLLPAAIKFCVCLWKIETFTSTIEVGEESIESFKALKPVADCVRQKLYENSTLAVDSYVTRLQLLVKGTGSASCLSEQCKEYFLEAQLMRTCQRLTITAATPTEEIVSKWDKLFKRTTLFSVTKSFRPLLARWIRWSLMIHSLRHSLAKHTAVGVVGLVNSGKSQLVKKLFQIKVSCNDGAVDTLLVPAPRTNRP